MQSERPPLADAMPALSVVRAPPTAYLCCCAQPLGTLLDVDSA